MSNIQGKRYLVFAGDEFHGRGGWADFVMATDDPEKATSRATLEYESRTDGGWAEVIDLVVSLPVWRKGNAHEREA